ncbi:hypothetical protein TNCV_3002951 [Trichonephila clavipes]|nr:hypothetical protein TNCV_3002951 [Trichonephila clavipes]
MVHEDELTIEKLQEILNEEHQETQRNVSSSEEEEGERGPMPTSAIKDLKKWEAVRAMGLKHLRAKEFQFDVEERKCVLQVLKDRISV